MGNIPLKGWLLMMLGASRAPLSAEEAGKLGGPARPRGTAGPTTPPERIVVVPGAPASPQTNPARPETDAARPQANPARPEADAAGSDTDPPDPARHAPDQRPRNQ